MSRFFKAYNTLGKPLCPCCGSNPRSRDAIRCGRCLRENRSIRWDRLCVVSRANLALLGVEPSAPPNDNNRTV